MRKSLVRFVFLVTLGVLVGLVVRQFLDTDRNAGDAPVSDEITASAEWAESGVVVILPTPLSGSEYHGIWVRSDGIKLIELPQLSENSWLVPWRNGTIGGILCTENSCTVFETQWAVASSYLWLKILGTLVVSFLVFRFIVCRFLGKICPSIDSVGGVECLILR